MRFRVPGLYAAVRGRSTVRMDAEQKRRGSEITRDCAVSPDTAAAPPMREGGHPPSWADLHRFEPGKVNRRKHTIRDLAKPRTEVLRRPRISARPLSGTTSKGWRIFPGKTNRTAMVQGRPSDVSSRPGGRLLVIADAANLVADLRHEGDFLDGIRAAWARVEVFHLADLILGRDL